MTTLTVNVHPHGDISLEPFRCEGTDSRYTLHFGARLSGNSVCVFLNGDDLDDLARLVNNAQFAREMAR